MSLLLKQLFSLIKLLNSETGTTQIASGVSLGFILGMSPLFSLQSLLVFLLLFIFRIQLGAAFASAFFFKFIAYLLDPVCHDIGNTLLQKKSLEPLFTHLYNLPIIPLTRFNNTIVLGSGVLAILFLPIVFIGSTLLIKKYRKTVVARFEKTKLWKAIKATSLYQWYYRYERFNG